jgi:hypothetical protein
VSSDDLRARIRARFGDGIPERVFREDARTDQTTAARPVYPAKPAPVDLPQIVWPVKLTLPWSYLISDNERHGVINGKLLLKAAYRRAKGLTRALARARLGNVEAVSFPVRLEAMVWVPDDIRAHDVPNFGKCVHDALETVVYVKDRWLWKASWERAGVDVDAPRAELLLVPHLTGPTVPARAA